MAHILFGVAGEGSGHSSRARVIIDYLESKGHRVKVMTYHKGIENLSMDYDVERIFGLRFFYKNNRVSYPATILANIKKIPNAHKSLKRVRAIVSEFKPDIILTDFEPLTGLVAHAQKIPLVSIDNQHRITHGTLDLDVKWNPDYLITKAGVGFMVYGADHYIITSFFDINAHSYNVHQVPPILRGEILNATPSDAGHIVVYSTSFNTGIIPLLQKRDERYVIYGLGEERVEGNCTFKSHSSEGFLADLVTSHAVIATAGLTLITESLHLGKPYLALPVKRQFEQLVNAYYLKKLGYGDYSEGLTAEELDMFLNKMHKYRDCLASYERHDNSKLFLTLDTLINI